MTSDGGEVKNRFIDLEIPDIISCVKFVMDSPFANYVKENYILITNVLIPLK